MIPVSNCLPPSAQVQDVKTSQPGQGEERLTRSVQEELKSHIVCKKFSLLENDISTISISKIYTGTVGSKVIV